MQATIVFKKNWEAINSLDEFKNRKYRYIINEGSSRSSKTRSLIDLFYLFAFSNSNKRLSVWRDTKKDCKDTVFFDMLKAYRTLPNNNLVTHFKTDSVLSFPNNSQIEIKGTDDEEQVHGYSGDVLWINEPYKISKDTFDQLDQRTSEFVIIDWNPKKAHWIDDLKKDSRTIVIHSTFKDNPFCPIEQRRKILSYQSVKMSSVVVSGLVEENLARKYDLEGNPLNFADKELSELARCLNNEYTNSANDFKWSVYGLGIKAERPNRIFNFKEISDQEYNELDVPIYYACDWGKVDNFGIIEGKYYDGGLYLKELNYDSENTIMEKLTRSERNQVNQHEEGLVKWLFMKLGIDNEAYIICDNNRPTKILALREAGFEFALAASKPKGSILDGIDLLDKLDVYYTSSSINLKYEQENYSRKVDRYGIVLEEPEDLNNHLMDPARYLVTFLQSEGIITII